MAENTHVFVGSNGVYDFPTRLTYSRCSPGSTQYMHGVISFASSGGTDETIAAKQWEQGDVIVCGISYDSGPASVDLSFPGKPKVTASPNPSVIYWLSPEYTSLWHLAFQGEYFGPSHQIDIPLGFPNGTVQVSRWAGFIPANQPLVASSIIWQDSESHTFTVSDIAPRLPQLTLTNVRFIPNPTSLGTPSYCYADYHSNVPSGYTPFIFLYLTIDQYVNPSLGESYRSIRHPSNAMWTGLGGGGSCCNCYGYPMPPPNGCGGVDTWTELPQFGHTGLIYNDPRIMDGCLVCFNAPGGLELSTPSTPP